MDTLLISYGSRSTSETSQGSAYDEHHRSGIGLPDAVGGVLPRVTSMQRQRAAVLAGYRAHPERFKGKRPMPPALPSIVGVKYHCYRN
jgi:hypothetical protein